MITVEEVKNLERLSRINLSDAEREKYAVEMSDIMDYINEIKDLNVAESMPEYTHSNVFRDDINVNSEGHRVKALKNAPDTLGDYYKVSQVIKQ